ncbi:unnamed protein product [Lathyrus sativus]|nr:unnamed protein product [Lathyrus sativus]
MENWRKNQRISNHQVGDWRSSSYNGKPPLGKVSFCFPFVSFSFVLSFDSFYFFWFIDKRYMYMHSNVMNWEDYAVKEAFEDEKFRFWAENNGFSCNIPLPDPSDMYIDDVDWNTNVDSELSQQNDSQRWISEEYHAGDLHDKYQARNNANGNWGTWEGNNRRRDNGISWSMNPTYQNGNNQYDMNRGRGNGGRGRGRRGGGGRGRGRTGGAARGRVERGGGSCSQFMVNSL